MFRGSLLSTMGCGTANTMRRVADSADLAAALPPDSAGLAAVLPSVSVGLAAVPPWDWGEMHAADRSIREIASISPRLRKVSMPHPLVENRTFTAIAPAVAQRSSTAHQIGTFA